MCPSGAAVAAAAEKQASCRAPVEQQEDARLCRGVATAIPFRKKAQRVCFRTVRLGLCIGGELGGRRAGDEQERKEGGLEQFVDQQLQPKSVLPGLHVVLGR